MNWHVARTRPTKAFHAGVKERERILVSSYQYKKNNDQNVGNHLMSLSRKAFQMAQSLHG